MSDRDRALLEALIAQRKRCGAEGCRTRNCKRCRRGAQLTVNRVINGDDQ